MRLFIAVPVPPQFAAGLDSVLSDLRAALPTSSWPKPVSFHLTLAFLGDQDERAVPRICTALSSAVSPVMSFTAVPSRFGVFPDERRARVGWIRLEPHGPFAVTAARVRGALASESISFDDKPFFPHLTVVRMRTPWKRSDVSRFVEAPFPRNLVFGVPRVVLYRSSLTPSGAVHSEEGSFPLMQTDDSLAVPRP